MKMILLPESEFAALARSNSEKWALRLMQSQAEYRGPAWLLAIVWTGIFFFFYGEPRVMVTAFMAGSWGAVILSHLAHSVTQVLRRALAPRGLMATSDAPAPAAALHASS